MLEREGYVMNHKTLYRIYREEGLTVRKRGGCKRAVGTRTPMVIPQGPNQRMVTRLRVGRIGGWSSVPCAERL